MNNFNKKAVFAALMGALSSVSSFAMESSANVSSKTETIPPYVTKMSMNDLVEFDWPHRPSFIKSKTHPFRNYGPYYGIIKSYVEKAMARILKDPKWKAIVVLNRKVGGKKLLIYQDPWRDLFAPEPPPAMRPTLEDKLDRIFRDIISVMTTNPFWDDHLKNQNRIRIATDGMLLRLEAVIRNGVSAMQSKTDDVGSLKAGAETRFAAQFRKPGDIIPQKQYMRVLVETYLKHELCHVLDHVLTDADHYENLSPPSKPFIRSMPATIPCTPYSILALARNKKMPKTTTVTFQSSQDIRNKLINLPQASTSELFAECLTIALDENPSYIPQDTQAKIDSLRALQKWGKTIMDTVIAKLGQQL